MAPGPSLTVEDAEYVRGKARLIAISSAYLMAPWADVLYACDGRFWRWHKGVQGFKGLKFALKNDAKAWSGYGVRVLKNTGFEGLELEPTGLKNGRNSGYQAINLAVHLGASRIVLLGYDMQRGPKGEEHYVGGDHPMKSASPFQVFLKFFPTLVAPLKSLGIEIVNCTARTELKAFPQMPLAEAVPALRQEACA